jgi:flagellar hook-associated protein 3 FlgL
METTSPTDKKEVFYNMRVTQSMLSSNMLRNLNNSYGKMSKLQDQINSGSKITRPSDDPVVAVKGMGYRRDLAKVEQYTRNMITAGSWLDSTDESLNQVGEQMKRVRELVIQAANDTNTPEEREKAKMEIDQIRQQIQDVGNTNIGGSYIFSGTNTNQPLFIRGGSGKEIDPTINNNAVNIEIYDGIQIPVNTPGKDLFKDLDDMMGKISDLLGDSTKTGEEISDMLGGVSSSTTDDDITALHNKVLAAQADIGARQNRVEMMENRLGIREVNVTKQLRDNESVDYSKAITEMVTHESIHQAALSVGSKIIQQTLVDFIR